MPSQEARLLELAAKLGIESIPDSWRANWAAFSEWVRRGKCARPRWELPPDAADVFDLPAECLPDLQNIYSAIRADERLCELADFWHYLIYHHPEGMERNTNVWALPDELLGHPTRLLSLAAMVSGADHARDNFARTSVNDEVISATLGYIGRYARDIREKRGVWGLESVGWLSIYVRAEIFRLGRLTFKAGRYRLPFRAFRSRQTGEVLVLCESSARYRGDGLADGTNGVFDPDAWTPSLQIGESSVSGCPVSPGCVASREPVTLGTDEWEQVLAVGDDIVEVHIAGGSKLLPDECAEAYAQAVEFFPRYYPRVKFAAFTCWSWLLDPGLAKILPSESNIVAFQRSFHLTPVASNEAQAYDLVFGDAKADPAKCPKTTRLQHAIADYVAAGNKMRSAAGVIIWEEAVAMAKSASAC